MNSQLRDVYGNPIRQTDEYGNPVQQSGTMGSYDTGVARHGSQDVRHDPLTRTDYGVAGVGTQTTTTGHQHAAGYDTGNPTPTGYQGGSYDSGLQHHRPHETGPAMVHLTGTHSDSSSSEDDELGGRRKKKGLREKIKEKLPGGKPQTAEYGATTTPGLDPHTHHEEHEKKGIMEKIKEKLPGSH